MKTYNIESIKQYIEENDLKRRDRHQEFNYKRIYITYLLRNYFGLPFERIGEIVGRNHSNCIHALRNHEHLKYDTNYNYYINEIEQVLNPTKQFSLLELEVLEIENIEQLQALKTKIKE